MLLTCGLEKIRSNPLFYACAVLRMTGPKSWLELQDTCVFDNNSEFLHLLNVANKVEKHLLEND